MNTPPSTLDMNTDTTNTAIAMLKSAIEKSGLTQEELAGLLGRAQPTISEILRGRRSISPEIAIDLEEVLYGEVTAAKLLEQQAVYQLQVARRENKGKGDDIRLKVKLRSEFPVSEMEKRGWITKSSDINAKVKAVLSFAKGSTDLDNIRVPFDCQPLARQSATLGYLAPTSNASRAWQYRVRELAEMTPVKSFDHEDFVEQGLEEIRSLVRVAKNVAQVPQVLARYGVRFVIVEHLSGTKLDGIATWLDSSREKSPVIALTLRFGQIDKFWFNLAHELHHIVLKHAFSVNEDGGEQGELMHIEDDANREAAEWLIPTDRLEAFIRRHKGKFSEASIMAFSEIVDVHPGILVGMLQHRGVLQYSRFTETKVDIRRFVLMAAMADGFQLPAPKRT